MENKTNCPACRKALNDPGVLPCDHSFCLGCLQQLVDPRLLPCGHTYCLSCLEIFKKRRRRVQCQICRTLHRVPDDGVNGFNGNPDEIKKETRNCWRSTKFFDDFLKEFAHPDDDEQAFFGKAIRQIVAIYDDYSERRCNNLECKHRKRRLSTKFSECWVRYCSKKCRYNDYHHGGHRRDCDDILYFKDVIRELHRRRHVIPTYRSQLSLLVSLHDPHCCSKCRRRLPTRELKLCSGCATARYCSKKCQIKDWKRKHKKDCGNMCRLRDLLYRDNPHDVPEDENMSNEEIDNYVKMYQFIGQQQQQQQPRRKDQQQADAGDDCFWGLTDEDWDHCIEMGHKMYLILCA